ncbi:hypothetical protein NBT05_18000 [Aquimarina sp. ERC-38]|uniref:hypothetical protein n=1 Tax=Aquimarina sp. ERC-38 TaxID=2949996 RepID=UPI002245883A|nr:hypothetical protein [Aquimarina sp. ERC-38]UZO80819.1 hypothetical protein NBT05_18000 [Aquimarina sp. ERC-38]
MKNLKNLGKVLSKAEQKTINGGGSSSPFGVCYSRCGSTGGYIWRGMCVCY